MAEAVDGRDLLLADQPRAFADQVVLLLSDAGRRQTLGAAARAFVAANWSWETLFLKLEGAFYDAIDGRPTDPAPSAIRSGRSGPTGAGPSGSMPAA